MFDFRQKDVVRTWTRTISDCRSKITFVKFTHIFKKSPALQSMSHTVLFYKRVMHSDYLICSLRCCNLHSNNISPAVMGLFACSTQAIFLLPAAPLFAIVFLPWCLTVLGKNKNVRFTQVVKGLYTHLLALHYKWIYGPY